MPERLEKYHRADKWRGVTFPLAQIGDPVPIGDDLDLIYSSILQILNTRRGERPGYAEFGSDLRSIQWQPHDPLTEQEFRGEILRALTRWEPRVLVEDITFPHGDNERNQGIFIILLTVRVLNNPRVSRTFRLPISSGGAFF